MPKQTAAASYYYNVLMNLFAEMLSAADAVGGAGKAVKYRK
jgi:hypothetical protein